MWNNNLNFLYLPFSSLLQGMRPDQGIPKVAVLLTDGYSNGRAVAGPASQLRNIGVNIFSIGVGQYVNPSELNTIATDPDSTHVFRMNSFNDLAGWVDKLSAVSCDGKCIINRQRRFWATYVNQKWGLRMQRALFRANLYPESSGLLVSGATRSNLDTFRLAFVLLHFQQDKGLKIKICRYAWKI